jgi:regulator of sirC expression with transglutaminase-like and TPR domain
MAERSSGGPWTVTGRDAESAARRRFADLVARRDVPLAEAALAIAEEEYPRLDAGRYLGELDALARQVLARAAGHDPASMLRALRTVLFAEAGFRGNADDYYDPRNSFLNEVMERRVGIPITLSVVYLDVAARAGFPAQGVSFPGHFLVKHVTAGREVFVDAFDGGELLSADDLRARHRARASGHELDPRALEGVAAQQILARMLHNLKRIYAERGDDARALWVVDRLLLLSPDDPVERRDHGLLAARLGGVNAAIADLEAYLAAAPDAADAGEVRTLVDQLRGGRGAKYVN